MSDAPIRVILLARPGEACTRLEAAVREAGAEIAAVCDPVDGDPAALAPLDAQAVLVALEPTVEDALDRFEALLADPSRIVIFDEAELAAQREGWDAARWARHLGAKLNRHDDVLPPGGETEADWQPVPGPLASSRIEIGELDISAFTGEALERASDVPRDARLQAAGEQPAGARGDGLPKLDFDLDSIAADPDLHLPEADMDGPGLAAGLLSAEDMDWSSASAGFDATSLEDNEFAAFLRNAQALAEEPEGAGAAGGHAAARTGSDFDDDADHMDDVGDVGDVDDVDPAQRAVDPDDGDLPAAADAGPPSFAGTLSLADDDAPIAASAGVGGQRIDRDLDALEQRVAGLSLADSDSYGHGPLRGAVLLEGGLGGPDAVRQLLAALPDGFPRAVLVRLHLDGGRYDRLVKQMQRASALPVALAVAGEPAAAGTVHFLPPEVTVEPLRGGLVFAASAGDAESAAALYSALPATDSAVLFLSGSSPTLLEAARALQSRGGLLCAQSPDTCYDAAGAAAVIAIGGLSESPSALGEHLAERWAP
ncbi:MAG TPA: chemotaxis protein CheB [Luteimonas sp.]|nr:chemotaxis protein CheB [Luteimonas sp.]